MQTFATFPCLSAKRWRRRCFVCSFKLQKCYLMSTHVFVHNFCVTQR